MAKDTRINKLGNDLVEIWWNPQEDITAPASAYERAPRPQTATPKPFVLDPAKLQQAFANAQRLQELTGEGN